ncbi:hypothetical protein GCM10010272_60290 [Streptomyces lateritius]|nr:hypothetical protein GCM10010272_60290 [Streptomyces lateritius]
MVHEDRPDASPHPVAPGRHQDQAPLHQHRRLALLRRTPNDDSLPLRTRVAAALVLLYAQPVTRIVRLDVDDVTDDGTAVTVRLGDPPSSFPEPVAAGAYQSQGLARTPGP